MSNAALVAQVTTPTEFHLKIADNVAHDVLDGATGIITILRFEVNENNGSAPSLTVAVYDGTNTIYLGSGGAVWKAKAMTAGQSVDFDKGYVLPQNGKLRITSSDAAGRLDIYGIYIIGRRTG